MMFRNLLAGWAMDAARIELPNQCFEACGIVWILAFKFHERVKPFATAGSYWIVSINLAHTANHGISAYFRQRDTYQSLVSISTLTT
jgi:hypothetical protein